MRSRRARARPARDRSSVMTETIGPVSRWRSASAKIALSMLALIVFGARSEAQVPSAWTYADVGNVGIPGSATYSNNTLTIKAAGADIWGTADSFGYLYQPFVGEGWASVSVFTLQVSQPHVRARHI